MCTLCDIKPNIFYENDTGKVNIKKGIMSMVHLTIPETLGYDD